MATTYQVRLTGVNPLLMRNDNIAWSEVMKLWEKDPANRSKSVAGDDRTPSYRWIGNLYHDVGLVVIPSDNIMTTLREGGAKCPTGKKGGTFKRQTQSGLVVDQSAWPVEVDGRTIDFREVQKLMDEPDFTKHQQAVEAMGNSQRVTHATGKYKHGLKSVRKASSVASRTAGDGLTPDESRARDHIVHTSGMLQLAAATEARKLRFPA